MKISIDDSEASVRAAPDACCGGHGHDAGQGHKHDHDHGHDHGHEHEHEEALAAPGHVLFRIATMDCAVEEGEIRRALEPVAGIRGLRFRLGARTLAIDADAVALEQALAVIRRAGFDPKPVTASNGSPGATPDGGAADADHRHAHDDHEHGAGAGIRRLGAALALALAAEAVSYFAPPVPLWSYAGMAIAAIAIWLAGIDTYTKGFGALRGGRLNINALMTVAVTGAFLLGQWPEAAMVMALYAIAELIEARSVDRARNAVQGLMALAPETAEVRQADGGWRSVATSGIGIGEIVRIKPGERVPLDGSVTEGRSTIDQAPVTGESIPIDKSIGDPVFAGTINQAGALEIRVSAGAGQSTLARIIEAVEQAQASRAPTQRFVDRFAAVYTPAVFVIALAVAVLMPLLAGLPWLEAAYKALVLLVIACPCALVISTPVTVVSGLAAAARKGILVKGGSYLEQARLIRAVALDKTGTITEGRPKLVHWETLSAADVAALAASLAARSDHPVSQAIAEGLPGAQLEVGEFEALAGLGVQGRIGGKPYALGNHRLVHGRGLCSNELEAKLAEHEAAGRSLSLLVGDGAVLALFAVADTLKASSTEAVAELILVFGALFGVIWALIGYAATRGQRDFSSVSRIVATRYEVLVEHKLAAQGRELLAQLPGHSASQQTF